MKTPPTDHLSRDAARVRYCRWLDELEFRLNHGEGRERPEPVVLKALRPTRARRMQSLLEAL